jgi:hypothetical protein
MSGSFLTGPPRKADQGGKGGFDFLTLGLWLVQKEVKEGFEMQG